MTSIRIDIAQTQDHSEGFLLLRPVPSGIGLTLSLRDDGDMELLLNHAQVAALREALARLDS